MAVRRGCREVQVVRVRRGATTRLPTISHEFRQRSDGSDDVPAAAAGRHTGPWRRIRCRRCSVPKPAVAPFALPAESVVSAAHSADPRARPRARGGVMSELLLDRAGRRRSPATMPGFHAGRPPRNKGLRYPADPPKVEEIIAVMRAAGDGAHGRRLRGLIVILWRAGLRIQEALALAEADLDQRRGSLLVRRGKGGRRREVGMDAWGWDELQPWLETRVELPVGPLFCVLNGATRGAMVQRRRPHRAAPDRGRGRRAPALRAAPAAPRPRRRDGARRRAADRHPAPARPQQPRHHLRLPARDRQRRDHRQCRPRAAAARVVHVTASTDRNSVSAATPEAP